MEGRSARVGSLPRPVWIDSTSLWNHHGGSPPSVGILLEWRQAVDIRGRPSWEGLIIWANAGSGRWSSGCTWMRSQCIRPMIVADWKSSGHG
ncbi:hypothetical protein ABLE68_17350 [Nocardioides sp. CN2-186]|uniref:hypothetical protein n=1 Tax=Nocardioides tweenelious TaxID=3156607 RepID=UPI0032B492B7